jgi:hypothetical protein
MNENVAKHVREYGGLLEIPEKGAALACRKTPHWISAPII